MLAQIWIDHDANVIDRTALQCMQYVREQTRATNLVQHLRPAALHASAFAGGKDNCVDLSHLTSGLGVRSGARLQQTLKGVDPAQHALLAQYRADLEDARADRLARNGHAQ